MQFVFVGWCVSLAVLSFPAVEPAARRDASGDALPLGAVQRLGTTRLRHGGMVRDAAFSPDGKYLASSGEDGPIRLWEPRSGKLIRHFQGPNQRVYSIAFSPDSKQLASTGGWPGYSIHIWNCETGREVHGLDCNDLSQPWAMAWSPDGKWVASAHGSHGPATLALWDTATGQRVRRFRRADSEALSVVFTPDGKRLVSGGSDGSVQLWDVETGKEIRLIGQSKGWAFRVAVSNDGRTVAAAGSDPTVRLWEIETGKEIARLRGEPAPDFPGITGGLAFSRDGKKLVTGGMDRKVRVWDLASSTEMFKIEGGIPPLALAPDDATLAMTGRDQALRLWDLVNRKEIPTPDGPRNPISALGVSPDGTSTAISEEWSDLVRIYDNQTGRELHRWVGGSGIDLLRFAPDGKELLARRGREIFFVDPSTGQRHRKIDAAFAGPATYSADGQRLAFCGSGTQAVIWDVKTHKQICQCGVEPGTIVALAFAPNAQTLAVASDGNRISVWDAKTGERKLTIGGMNWRPQSVAFTPAGDRIVSDGGESLGFGVWDSATGQLQYKFGGYPELEVPRAISPEGRLLASSAPGDSIVVRELASGAVRRRLKGHLASVSAVAFGSSCRLLVSTSRGDTSALVWDVYAPLGSRPPELASFWDDLASPDGEKAHAAIIAALHAPDRAVAVLKQKLRAADAVPQEILTRLIDQLVDDHSETHQQAAAKLIDLDDAAAPALRRALDGGPPPQLRSAIESITNRPRGPTTAPGALRIVRAVEFLSVANTPEARALLEILAGGAPGFRQTKEAIAAQKLPKQR